MAQAGCWLDRKSLCRKNWVDIDGRGVSRVCVPFQWRPTPAGVYQAMCKSAGSGTILPLRSAVGSAVPSFGFLGVRRTRRCWSQSSGGQWGPQLMWWVLRFLQPHMEEAEGVYLVAECRVKGAGLILECIVKNNNKITEWLRLESTSGQHLCSTLLKQSGIQDRVQLTFEYV